MILNLVAFIPGPLRVSDKPALAIKSSTTVRPFSFKRAEISFGAF
jgi:hypothetical protein